MDDFYIKLEQEYRGSRNTIKERLQIYLPYVEPLKKVYNNPEAIDLGCGRGEWLELLLENGFNAKGIDTDYNMVKLCQNNNLSVEKTDGLSALKALPDESQTIVSSFHVIEHIPFDDFRMWIAEAKRVLKPAGLLILETPNPENVVVGTTNFYLDPTHLNPIPATLLCFLAKYYEFYRFKVLRLQGYKDWSNYEGDISLHDVLTGLAYDTGLVAQKAADIDLSETEPLYESGNYNSEIYQLAAGYDRVIQVKIDRSMEELESLKNQIYELEKQLQTITGSLFWRLAKLLIRKEFVKK